MTAMDRRKRVILECPWSTPRALCNQVVNFSIFHAFYFFGMFISSVIRFQIWWPLEILRIAKPGLYGIAHVSSCQSSYIIGLFIEVYSSVVLKSINVSLPWVIVSVELRESISLQVFTWSFYSMELIFRDFYLFFNFLGEVYIGIFGELLWSFYGFFVGALCSPCLGGMDIYVAVLEKQPFLVHHNV